MYESYDYSEEFQTRRATPRKYGVSKTFAFGVISLALLLGFTLGLLSVGSLSGSPFKSTSLYDEELVTSLFEDVSPAIVEISVTSGAGGLLGQRVGTGSGFLIDREGHIITNYHVIEGADEISIKLSNGKTLPATRLGTSPADDLAVIQVDASEVADIEPLAFADSTEVKPGQLAIAIGSPFRNFNSVTVGVVSGTGRGPTSVLRRPIPDMIQTDAPLNPGNSGGPLLNSKGEVIGINSAVRTGSFQGIDEFRIGFAVPSNTVKNLMPDLISAAHVVKRPWLGISGAPLTRDLISSLGIEEGIFITRVFRGSPAEHAGLVPFLSVRGGGDVITAIDGTPVGSVEDMVSYFNTLRPGDDVTLSVFRNTGDVEIKITLAEWPDT